MVWTLREREEEESRKTCICGKQGGTRLKMKGEFTNKPETKRGKEILEDRRTGSPRGQVERVDSPGSGSLKSDINRRTRYMKKARLPISHFPCEELGVTRGQDKVWTPETDT